MLLGTVPVEADGSAYFRAPARQAALLPGGGRGRPRRADHAERHLPAAGRAAQLRRLPRAAGHRARRARPRPCWPCAAPPSHIEPGPEGTQPLSYPLLVQPVLDRHCVRCHDGSQGEGKPRRS